MLFYLGTISAFLIRSANENLYFSLSESNLNFSMTPEVTKATNFSLKSRSSGLPGENYISVDSEKFLDIGYNGSARLRRTYGSIGTWLDAFKLLLTEKGTFVIMKNDKCLGYEKSTKIIGLVNCDTFSSNIFMVFEGGDSVAYNSHKMLHDASSIDEIKFANHLDFDHGIEGFHSDYPIKIRNRLSTYPYY